jgi:Family of unknown function (DUF6049)
VSTDDYDWCAAMNTHQAGRAIFVLAIALAGLVVPTAGHAQDTQDVTLRLLRQTAWTSPRHSLLQLRLQAHNEGAEAIGDLSVGISIGTAMRSRTTYDEFLDEGLTSIPIYSDTELQTGTLEPGEPRVFELTLDLSEVERISVDESAVYPAQLNVWSGDQPIASAPTPLIHIVKRPQSPVALAWWTEITARPALDPEGRLADADFEASIARRGSLRRQVEALDDLAQDPDRLVPIDVVIEPSVVDELARMADGYTRTDETRVERGEGGAANAETVLDALRRIASDPDVSLSATPFAAPDIPSLLEGRLIDDIDEQLALGDETIRTLLGVEPIADVARPPGGSLSDAAVDVLVEHGAGTLLANDDTVERPLDLNEFAPPPIATIDTTRGTTADLVLPDPQVESLLERQDLAEDPVRMAQVVFGELALIWREVPVPTGDTVRGVALRLPVSLPGQVWRPLMRAVADAPFLRPVRAADLVEEVGAPETSTTLFPTVLRSFTADYVATIKEHRRNVAALDSTLPVDDPLPDRLERSLLYAESAEYLTDEVAGRAWLNQVGAATSARFLGILPETTSTFSLTSRTGVIPVRLGDPGPTPITVVVQLRSNRFTFPDGDRRTVQLERPGQIVTFRVEALATERSRVVVLVRAPSDTGVPAGRILDREELIIRVTTLNRVALLVTGAAALTLAVLWSRRWWRRATS